MWRWLKKVEVVLNPAVREETHLLVNLILKNQDWEKSNYVWYHPSGVNMWIANIDLGISVKWNSANPHDYELLGSTAWCANFLERRLIEQAMKAQGQQDREDQIQKVARKILEMYD